MFLFGNSRHLILIAKINILKVLEGQPKPNPNEIYRVLANVRIDKVVFYRLTEIIIVIIRLLKCLT